MEKHKRKVYLHVGPTNSGKTHQAMEKLKQAENGIYLAPLRLLAYEIYNQLNDNGIPCTMETGEEKKETDGAKHFSKTIELFNPKESYEVAIIDCDKREPTICQYQTCRRSAQKISASAKTD